MNESYTNVEIFELPSKGKIYSKEIDPIIKLRSMTTQEEMRRLSPSSLSYLPMCDIIDSCIVNDKQISSYDLCLGDYLFLLHRLRVVTYGKDYKMTVICPFCHMESNEVVDLTTLPVKEFTDDFYDLQQIELPVTKKYIKLNYQTPRMLDKISEKNKTFRKKTGSDIDQTLLHTLQLSIAEIDGKTPNQITLEQWLKDLPMKDTNFLLGSLDKLNSSIGIDLNLVEVCDTCGLKYITTFKTTSEFFRPAL